MKRTIFVLFSILLPVSYAQAQTRVLAKVDSTKGSVADQEFEWYAVEAEVEKSFKKNKLLLSGFAIGLRRETQTKRWDEGTYFTFRTFRTQRIFKKHPIEVIPSVTVLWGSPGVTLNRTAQERYDEFIPYVSVFPLRNAGVPQFDVTNAGLIYPEISLAVRKTFLKNIISVEPVVGVRIIRFGVVEYNGIESHYHEETGFLPTLGFRVGLRIH